MIPKMIHYIWFGGAPLDALSERCIESWIGHCPDYEIQKWDESNFDVSVNRYCREAYEQKKWAFVSDYVRLWVLFNYGGIYMDTDVEVVKPLDAFLYHDAFSGFENETMVPTGIMASEKGFPLFGEMLAEYEDRRFVGEDGSLDTTTNVVAITEKLVERGLEQDNSYQVVDGLALYPKDWFCPKSHKTGIISLTENTHAIHHFNGSWVDPSERAVRKRKIDLSQRHPAVSPFIWGLYAALEHGVKERDFSPLATRIKKKILGAKG